MSDDPYAPRGRDAARAAGGGGTGGPGSRGADGTGTFDIGLCLSDAWAATWANFPLWLGAGLVALVAAVLATLTVIGVVLVLPVLLWGGVRFLLRMYDGGAALDDLFHGFSRYGTVLVTMIGLLLLLLLVQAVGQSVQAVGRLSQNDLVIGIGTLVNLAFGIFVLPRLSFAYLFAVDAGAGPVEAISRAWTLTRGVVWKVAALVLVNVLVVVIGVLALGIGVVPAVVIANLTWISAYRQMVGTNTAPASQAAPPQRGSGADPRW